MSSPLVAVTDLRSAGGGMSEISLAVGDGVRRMTYAELAQARGISISGSTASDTASSLGQATRQ